MTLILQVALGVILGGIGLFLLSVVVHVIVEVNS